MRDRAGGGICHVNGLVHVERGGGVVSAILMDLSMSSAGKGGVSAILMALSMSERVMGSCEGRGRRLE